MKMTPKTAEKLYQTDNNLWRIYGEQFSGQTKFQTAVSGDKLAPTLKGYIEDMFGDYLNLTINPEHHYTVTTKNPYTSTEDDPILTDTELTFTAFPDNESGEPVLTLSLPEEFTTDVDDPMKIVSWTLYGANNDGENYSNYLIPQNSKRGSKSQERLNPSITTSESKAEFTSVNSQMTCNKNKIIDYGTNPAAFNSAVANRHIMLLH